MPETRMNQGQDSVPARREASQADAAEVASASVEPAAVEERPNRRPRLTSQAPKTAPAWRKQNEVAAPQPKPVHRQAPAVRSKVTTRINREGVRQKAMMALIPILAITLFHLLKDPVGTSGGPTVDRDDPPPVKAPANTQAEMDWQVPPVYDPSLRDPMRLTPERVKVASEPNDTKPVEPHVQLVVTGILYSDHEPTAIVNTQVVREGQAIAGVTVMGIDRDSVEFEMHGRRWRQTVHNQD